MSTFVEQLRLAEKAAEDIYFAKINRELIGALRERFRAEKRSIEPSSSCDVPAAAFRVASGIAINSDR